MPRIVTSRIAVLAAVLMAVVLAQPLTQQAQAATIATPKTKTFFAGIDAYPGYQGQTTCNATAKPGVLYVKDLLNATYGPRTIGIVRNCSTGGTSEHKEGRALDWMISVRNTQQKAIADSFLKWLLATDRFGNTHAMARRMGVMYVIWNNKMWRGYDPGRGWAEYKNCSSTTSSGYDTTCHRDHIHISFTWDAAYARTSFFTGRVPFAVSASVSNSKPAVGDTVEIRGSVSPVAGSAGKRVAVKRIVGSTSQHLGYATIDSSGAYRFPYRIDVADTYRFKVFKSAEGCTSDGCAYGSATSNEVGFTVGTTIKGRYAVTIAATPDLVPDGTPVLISGSVTPTNASAGKRASLKMLNTDTGAYDFVQSLTIAADGSYTATVTPPVGVQRYLVYKPGDECGTNGCAYVAASSPPTEVDVRGTVPYEVEASSTLTTAPVGGTVRIEGSVAPSYAAPGTRVSLRKAVGDELVYVAGATVDPMGRFSIPVTTTEVGTKTFRVYKPSDSCTSSGCDFAAALSDPVPVEVVPVRTFSSVVVPPTTVLLGQPARIATGFSPASLAAGNTVRIQELIGGTWRTTATRTFDAKGRIEIFRSFATSGTRQFRFVTGPDSCESGVCAFSGGTSAPIAVRAVASGEQRFVVSTTASDTTPQWGSTVTIKGKVSPFEVAAGSTVSLRRQKDGELRYLASAKVDAEGRYSFTLTARGAGSQVYRVYKPSAGCSSYGCLWGADVSSRITLTVG